MTLFPSWAEIAELRATNAALTAQLADARADLDLEREARRSDAAAARKEREMLTDRLLTTQGGQPVYHQPVPVVQTLVPQGSTEPQPAGSMVPFEVVKSRVEALRQKRTAPAPRGIV